jgi:outer membrane protein
VAARENIKTQEKALELADRLYKENALKVRIGSMQQLDEKQAQSQLATSQASLITARRTLAEQENTVKNLISDQFESLRGVSLRPIDELRADPQPMDAAESAKTAFRLRPDLQQSLLDLEERGLTEKYRRNQIFPDVSLTGAYGHNASGKEFSDGLDQFATGTGPFYSYGVAVTIPLGNISAKQNLRITRAQKAQAEEKLKQLRQTIVLQIENAVVEVTSSLQQVDATRRAREYADDALQAGNTRMSTGKATSYEVLQLQRDLTSARSQEISALVDYNKSLSLLRQREGATLNALNIDLKLK